MDIRTAAEILQVPIDAAEREIKSKFRKYAKKYHPDLNPHKKGAEKKFKMYLEAYETLINYDGDRNELKSKAKRKTENTKHQAKRSYNSNDNYNYSQRRKESYRDNSVKNEKEGFNFIPMWLQIIIGLVLLEKVFQKGILGKVVLVVLILALSPVFYMVLFGVYMMAQLNITFGNLFSVIFKVIAVCIFIYMGYLFSKSIIKKYKAYQKMKRELPRVGEDTYPEDIENIRQTRFTHNIETTFICGHCGHRNIVVTEALEFEVKCKFCKTNNVVKLKVKKNEKK